MLSNEVLNFLKKNYGNELVINGDEVIDGGKLETGVFPLDFALNGGLPKGKITQIYGMKDSGKTTLCLSILGHAQSLGLKCWWVDVEHTFDKVWAEKLGVNCSSLLLFRPENAEMVIDIVDGMISCEDVHLGIIDSLGMLITENEISSFGQKQIVAGSSGVVTKLLRKVIHGQLMAEREGRFPTLLCVNQIRSKIGVMYGNPEYYPGGAMAEHAPSLNLRVSGKPIIDKQYNNNVPTKHHINMTVKKSKMTTLLNHIEFEIGLDNVGDLRAGKANDSELILKYLKSFNMVEKNEKGYIVCERQFKSQKEVKELLDHDTQWKNHVQNALIIKGGQSSFLMSDNEEK